ncbi:MAG TPA: tetratricopeptide repeat-containing diguanylate cyclase [Dokdonella sp.]|uniref:tetratricopeptide repeat-containing diguanylate cyclase n=1 Tax=Dokdonella sp. TaxID=2291710 RepID=UPI002D80F917|nr:tetratricopeptide repeat-containing diguanylate cyclase [Dokdonella sp.]HET9032349.1 tetratricopeptide repeat-containing diguanylate cyclase [Dokdonella sp.]
MLALMLAGSVAHAELPATDPIGVSGSTTASVELALLARHSLDMPHHVILSLAGNRAELLLARSEAHLMQALHAVEPAREAWRDVSRLAREVGDAQTEMRAIEQQAEMTLLLSNYDEASKLADALLSLSRRSHSRVYEASALGYHGVIARRRGDLDAALENYTASIHMLRESGDEYRLALMLGNLGTVLRDRGNFARSLELQLQALAIRERIGDYTETSLRNIALLYREIEDEESARRYFERALDAVDQHASPERYAPILGSYASLLNDVGDHADALKAASEALVIDTNLGNRSNQGLEQLEAGRALQGLGRSEEALHQLESALAIGRSLGQHEIVARALLSLAEINQTLHNSLRARGMIDEAIAGLESALLRPQLVQAYAIREKIALAEHDPEGALRYLRRYSEQRELLLGTRASRQLSDLQARHARAEADKDLALLQKDNELQMARLDKQEIDRQFSILVMISLGIGLLLITWRFFGVRKLNLALYAKNTKIDMQSKALAQANLRLEQRARELYTAAISDPLTGVDNRSHLRERIASRIEYCRSNSVALAVLLIDFDRFKQINDRLGHLFGDRVLLAGVAGMREVLNETDILGRFGGEEFVVVLEGSRAQDAGEIAEALRKQVQRAIAALDTNGIKVTVSIGIAFLSDLDPASANVDTLLNAGDRAMYRAKDAGRDQVVMFVNQEDSNHG